MTNNWTYTAEWLRDAAEIVDSLNDAFKAGSDLYFDMAEIPIRFDSMPTGLTAVFNPDFEEYHIRIDGFEGGE